MKKEKFNSRTELVLYYLNGSKRYFVAFILFSCLVSLLDLLNPRIISFAVDSIIGAKEAALPSFLQKGLDSFGGITWLRGNLWFVACIILVIAVVSAICRYMSRTLNGMGAEKLVHRMRNTLFNHILHLPFSWHSENRTGDIIQRCTSDVETIKIFVSEQLTTLFRTILMILMAMTFMFSMNVKLTLVIMLFIPILVGYSFFFFHRIGESFEKVDIEEGKLSSIVQENLTGVRVVRAFGREMYERKKFEQQNHKYTNMWVYLIRLLNLFWVSSDAIARLQILAVLAFGTVFCVHGEITPGEFIAFNSYTIMLSWPIRSLGRVISNMSKAGISIDRLMYIMNAEEEKDKEDAKEPAFPADIVFDHVSYHYGNNPEDILKDVSFTIPAGSTIGILGGTGSGKSTLMYLLDRLYELPEGCGSITIGGIPIQDIKASWLRKNIGMVLQEPYLFSRTLEENIGIANAQAEKEDILQASHIACLDTAVSHFKEGYRTFVGERGVTLSGGQKQRTAIAQMLVQKAPIMVFDDSLSAVDAETDEKIRSAIKENTEGSTVILIAHRITTLMNAEEILVLENGKILQHGTHEQLVQEEGIYKDIYELQSRSKEEAA